MARAKGSKSPIRVVACLGCGCELRRATYWRQPRCDACRRKLAMHRKKAGLRELREQARRYRILMHVLGWPDSEFDEALRELRASPLAFRDEAETRAARYDLALERRARRRSARAKGAA